jgi:hypothetical protein
MYVSDWASWDTLHIGDCAISPCITYNVYACNALIPEICSEPLAVPTQVMPWQQPRNSGDVSGPVTPDLVVSPPDGFMGIIDIQTYILTKQNWGTPNQPQAHATWVDLHGLGTGNPPNYHLNVSDLAQIMFAHLGLPWISGSGNLDPGQCP